ncbi:hypothetical protein MMC07_003808 [Pseudocyphellaria aurata]|nr:hypothetical protein [Pseudocyphellaria aurata]
MALAFQLVALLALSSLVSCQAYSAASLISDAPRSDHLAETGYGVPHQPFFSFKELYYLQNRLWKNFISPANERQQMQAKAINSTLLAEDVIGRLDITRDFQGRELNTEYLFGLFAQLAASPDSISLLGVPLSYEITHFAASQNIASASTRLVFKSNFRFRCEYKAVQRQLTFASRVIFNTTGFDLPVPVTIDTWVAFNSAKEISQYDAVFKWWPWALEYVLTKAAVKLGTKSLAATVEKFTEGLAESICSTAQDSCKGKDLQYASKSECLEFLTQKVRFGQAHELGRDTLLCRMLHKNMVPFRPAVHCPHIGKTGGGFCADNQDYNTTVTQNYFVNAPFVAFGAH